MKPQKERKLAVAMIGQKECHKFVPNKNIFNLQEKRVETGVSSKRRVGNQADIEDDCR